jgi:excisionase family DNA binding protein
VANPLFAATGTPTSSRLLTVAEVAEHLGVCRDTVYRMCNRGEFPHVRLANFLRVPAEELAVFLAVRRR